MPQKITRIERKYFPEELDGASWEELKPHYDLLLEMPIDSVGELINFWERVSELNKIIHDASAWLYFAMSNNANKKEYAQAYNKYLENVAGNTAHYDFKFNKKFVESNYFIYLNEERFGHLKRILLNEIELFREENVKLFVEEQKLTNIYGETIAKMEVDFQGEKKTVQQMAAFLKNENRDIREQAWRLIATRFQEDAGDLNELFDQLKKIRIQIAKNADFENYRDYMHKSKKRFSYTPQDLFMFHDAVENEIVPILKEFDLRKKEKLDIKILRPWDMDAPVGREMKKPFVDGQDFIKKTIKALSSVDSEFGVELAKMNDSGFLDLETRPGKAPGGYCYGLMEYRSSLIFMNAVGVHRDVQTLIHEMGHSLHNALAKGEVFYEYLSKPSEIAELASQSMELLSMNFWDVYYDKDDLKKAKFEQILGALSVFPWVMVVDAFQQWIYLSPDHTVIERNQYFSNLMDRFSIGGDWTSLEREKAARWLKQMHIFDVPFYYIEYAISQLGAIAVYRNFKTDPKKSVEDYKEFLSLAYSKPIDQVYAAAGIKFDFSAEYIRELANFMKNELLELEKE